MKICSCWDVRLGSNSKCVCLLNRNFQKKWNVKWYTGNWCSSSNCCSFEIIMCVCVYRHHGVEWKSFGMHFRYEYVFVATKKCGFNVYRARIHSHSHSLASDPEVGQLAMEFKQEKSCLCYAPRCQHFVINFVFSFARQFDVIWMTIIDHPFK